MNLKGEETFFGEYIKTPEQYIEDVCDRINILYDTVMKEDDRMKQLAYLIGFLIAFKGRLNNVCERL